MSPVPAPEMVIGIAVASASRDNFEQLRFAGGHEHLLGVALETGGVFEVGFIGLMTLHDS